MRELFNHSKKDSLNRLEQLEFLDYLYHSVNNGSSLSNSIEMMIILWAAKKDLLARLYKQMKNGHSFTHEMIKLGFSQTIVTQVNLALREGELIECLRQLTILSRLKNEQIKKLKLELSYPFILGAMMVVLLIFMQTFVSSQLNSHSDFTGDIILISLLILVIGTIYYFAKLLHLLAKQDYLSLKKLSKSLFIGKTITLYIKYLLVYDIGLLLASAFSLQKMCEYAVKQREGSLQNYLGKKIQRRLNNGDDLQKVIREEHFLPTNLLLLLETGSKRSDLSKRCLLLGRSLFVELTQKIEKLVISVQPVCFILLGLCILGMYLKLLLPMYSMMKGI